MTPLRQRMIEDMKLRNLSAWTQEVYVRYVADFARYFGKSPELLGPEEVRTYQVHLFKERGYCYNSLTVAASALKFFYRVTAPQDWSVEQIPVPKRPKRLPVVLSSEEVAQFFAAIKNIRYRAILMTAYGAGLRVSEITHLRVHDIDSRRMVIHVCQGKGKKDRYVMLSPRLLVVLRLYWQATRPSYWLFPGVKPNKPNSCHWHYRITGWSITPCFAPPRRRCCASGRTPNISGRNWASWPYYTLGARRSCIILICIASCREADWLRTATGGVPARNGSSYLCGFCPGSFGASFWRHWKKRFITVDCNSMAPSHNSPSNSPFKDSFRVLAGSNGSSLANRPLRAPTPCSITWPATPTASPSPTIGSPACKMER